MIKIGRKALFSSVAGIIIGFCYIAGYYLDNFDSVDLVQGSFYVKWLVASILAGAVVYGLWEAVSFYEKKYIQREGYPNIKNKILKWIWNFDISFGVSMVVLILCWLPALLSLFPGAFAYDACGEWEQMRDGLLTSHHPVIHVWVLGGLVEGFYSLTGNYNVGIGVYTILQMIGLAATFSYTIRFMKEFKFPGVFRLFALLFYGLSPVIQLFSISATKDVLFTAAQLIFFLHVIRFFARKDEFFQNKSQRVGFAVAALGTMILRNNGLYIVLIVLGIMFFACKNYWKKYMVILLGVLLPYLIYVGPIYQLLHVTPGGVEEMLSVPIQQIARVYTYNYDSIEQQDLELLYTILPKENLDSYRATVADCVKSGFQKEGFEANKKEFLKLWIKLGVKHPLSYINSFLINTVDFWYPHAVIDGYRESYGRSSYFDYKVDVPGTQKVLLPRMYAYYDAISWDKQTQQKPLMFLVLSPGWYFVLFIIMYLYLWCYRKTKLWVPMLILVLTMLTVLLGPMALVRYVLIFYYAFPVLLAIFFHSENC